MENPDYQFYKLPKALFLCANLQKLSIEAKILYALMLDRTCLSIKNKWVDDLGRVFIYFTIEDSCEILGKSYSRVSKVMVELEKSKLITRKRQGQGKPSKIYVKNNDLDVSEKISQRKCLFI